MSNCETQRLTDQQLSSSIFPCCCLSCIGDIYTYPHLAASNWRGIGPPNQGRTGAPNLILSLASARASLILSWPHQTEEGWVHQTKEGRERGHNSCNPAGRPPICHSCSITPILAVTAYIHPWYNWLLGEVEAEQKLRHFCRRRPRLLLHLFCWAAPAYSCLLQEAEL